MFGGLFCFSDADALTDFLDSQLCPGNERVRTTLTGFFLCPTLTPFSTFLIRIYVKKLNHVKGLTNWGIVFGKLHLKSPSYGRHTINSEKYCWLNHKKCKLYIHHCMLHSSKHIT